ncbi:hypothetical protein M427DRAFT_394973 [Gonapodya prolifera JEL478]|uniref:Uncharacterized protein n=1 Tax=Gonapodya prolifera (strain JEL478) TaxID=1344416 RepID=A0A139A6W6_GONPJ|nr:hypothetical protein M427DRAFT_394973 [Gonapodya prolifera JEL478]|eukprot:KXS12511.1 hypothetical protein M427DRAFT_394973 [Gonapodya prolifera JEL478]
MRNSFPSHTPILMSADVDRDWGRDPHHRRPIKTRDIPFDSSLSYLIALSPAELETCPVAKDGTPRILLDDAHRGLRVDCFLGKMDEDFVRWAVDGGEPLCIRAAAYYDENIDAFKIVFDRYQTKLLKHLLSKRPANPTPPPPPHERVISRSSPIPSSDTTPIPATTQPAQHPESLTSRPISISPDPAPPLSTPPDPSSQLKRPQVPGLDEARSKRPYLDWAAFRQTGESEVGAAGQVGQGWSTNPHPHPQPSPSPILVPSPSPVPVVNIPYAHLPTLPCAPLQQWHAMAPTGPPQQSPSPAFTPALPPLNAPASIIGHGPASLPTAPFPGAPAPAPVYQGAHSGVGHGFGFVPGAGFGGVHGAGPPQMGQGVAPGFFPAGVGAFSMGLGVMGVMGGMGINVNGMPGMSGTNMKYEQHASAARDGRNGCHEHST